MLGINELGTGTAESWAAQYKVLLDEVRELQPDAIIFLQAIFHTTQEKSDATFFKNSTIDARNAELQKLADNEMVFYIDWFRTDEDGNFAWPGFGDNMRVLQWIISRADDEIGAAETALGYEPNTHDIDMEGLEMSMYDMRRLLSVDRDLWLQECEDAREYYEKIGKVPPELYEELDALEMRLNRGYKVKHE